MSSASSDDRRNRSGLKYLRERYRRRAVYLIEDRASEYLNTIKLARESWSSAYPEWAARVTPMPDDLELGSDLTEVPVFWPGRLHEEWLSRPKQSHPNTVRVLVAHHDWFELAHVLARKFCQMSTLSIRISVSTFTVRRGWCRHRYCTMPTQFAFLSRPWTG